MKNKNYSSVMSAFKCWLCCFTVCLGLWTTNSNAQNVSTYDFAQVAGIYASIGSGTSALGAGIDDASGTAQSIGFNFTYHGTVFTQFVVQSNGYLGLGSSLAQSYSTLSSVANVIAFGAGDGRSGPSGVYYAVSGSAPNRVLTIEEPGYSIYYGVSTETVNIQVKLFETTNIIQIIYGASTHTASYTRQVGLTGATTADFAVRTTTTDWAATTLSGVNTGTMTWGAGVFPASGQMYIFSPHLTYCNPTVSVQDEHIINVTMGAINNNSAYGASGYSDFTTLAPALLTMGTAQAISVNTSPYYGSSDVVSIWIDYNHNGIFDASEITSLPSTGALMSGTVTPSVSALPGTTRMRIREIYASAADPCNIQSYGETEDYMVTLAPQTGCSGTPAASTTISSTNPACNNGSTTFTLSLGTTYAGSGFTYQWQTSPDNITWANGGGASTSATYITTETTSTYFRCIITCTNSGLTATSTALQVVASVQGCYCVPTIAATGNCTYDWIGNVTIGTINNTSGCTAPFILYPASGSSTTNLTEGIPYTISLQDVNYSGYFDVFIDYNQDGVFTTAERILSDFLVGPTASSSGTFTNSTTITVPLTALAGATRMRVRYDYLYAGYPNSGTGFNTGAESPCGQLYEGETEDYVVTLIAPPACSGLPASSNTVASANPVCAATNFTLSLSNIYSFTGMTYQWQSSSNGVTYANIGGATASSLTTTQSSATYYQCIVTCTNSSLSTTSTPLNVTMNSFVNCYCTPTYLYGTSGCFYGVINNVTLNTLNHAPTCINAQPYYFSNPASGAATTTLIPGQTYTLSVTSGYYNGIGVWIDFNQSGTYDASEFFNISGNNNSAGVIWTGTASVLVPLTATAGLTGMRVSSAYYCCYPSPIVATNGCGNSWSYGETEDYKVTVAALPAVPPNPSEAGIPNCATGGTVIANGSAPSGETWYWQSTATGTSTALNAATPQNILANGTYYIRSQNNTYLNWSNGAGSVTVSDFPAGPADPSVTAPGTGNPACGAVTLVSSIAGSGTTNYWQGTNPTGTSTASVADNGTTNNPYSAPADGTYYLRAQDNTSFCWSNAVAIPVSIYPLPTAPIVSASPATICPGAASGLTAVAPSAPPTGYSVSSLSFATIPSPISTSLANAGPTGDEGTVVANLGFTFNYYGTTYTQVQVHTDGYIVFGSNNYVFGSYSPPTIPSTANTNNWVGFWADLNASAGQITYATIGVAPNRQFIANYNQDPYYSATPYYSGQIVVNEASGSIDVYLGHTQTTNTGACGMENQGGTAGTAAPGENAGSWAVDNVAWHFAPIQAMGFLWTPNGAGSGLAAGQETLANATATPSATTTYTMTLTDPAHGCHSSNTVTVNVAATPPAPTGTDGSTVCGAGTVTLGASGTGGTLNWYRVPTGGTILGSGTSFTTPNPIQADSTFYVEEFNGTCTGPRIAVVAHYTVAPALSVGSDVSFVCNGGTNTGVGGNNNNTANLSASGTGYTSFTWSPATGLNTTSGANVVATPAATTTYTCTATGGGCTAVNSVTVNAGAVPVLTSTTATPPTICQGNQSQLSANVYGVNATNYNVTSIAYNHITPVSPVTDFAAGSGWDDSYSSAITLPFTFNFYGTTYSSIAISTNGYAQFAGTQVTSYGQIIPNTLDPNTRICGVHNDLVSGASGSITHFTSGTSPNQIFVIEFTSCGVYGSTGNYSFQIQLYQGTNVMEVHVSSATGSASDGQGKTIGVENAAGTIAAYPATRNGANASWDVSTPEAWRFAFPPPANVNFAWSPTGGLTSSTIYNPIATLGSPSQLYNVVVTDLYGCNTSGSVTLSEPSSNPGNTISTANPACASGPITLSVQNPGSGANYQWQTSPDGITWTNASGSSTSSTYSNTQSAATYYRCSVGCTSGSTYSNPLQVTQNPFYNCYCNPVMYPSDPYSYIDYLTTSGAITDLTTAVDAGYNGTGVTLFNTNIVAAQGNTFTLNVEAQGSSVGNLAYFSVWIDFNHNGVFDDPSEKLVNNVYAGTGNLVNYSITIPPTALSGLTHMRVIDWSNGGAPPPCGALSGYYGETEDYTITIGDANCVAAPIYPPIGGQICPDPNLTLSWPASAGATGYDVYFDAINGTTLVSPSQSGTTYLPPSVSATQTYYWKVVPLYASATCTTPQTWSFSFKAAPDPDASSNSPICEGFDLTLFGNNLASGQTSTIWAWSGPSFSSSQENPTISTATAAASGTYTLTVTNNLGCTASSQHVVTVNPNPVISIASQTSVSCNGDADGTVDLDATVGTSPYFYYLDAIPTTDGIYSGLAPGPHYADVTDDNGCVAPEVVVTIAEPPVLTVSAGSNTPVCSGNPLNLNSTPGGGTAGYSYAWTGPNGAVPAVQNPTIASATVADGGQYNLQITDAHGCTATTNHSVVVNASPTAAIAVSGSANKCLGQSATVQLTFTSTGPWTYTISGSGGPYSGTTSSNPANVNVTPAAVGAQNYTVTSIGNTACPTGGTGSGTATVYVSTGPPTNTATIPVPASNEACVNTVMLITCNTITGQNIFYSWNTGTNSSAVLFSTSAGGPFSAGPFQTSAPQVYAQFGALTGSNSGYNVCVQGLNGCGSTNNRCVFIRGTVSVPGTITPPAGVVACANTTQSYSCGASGGASVYSWTLNGATAPITSGQGTQNVSVLFPSGFTSGNLCVTASLACGGSSTSAARCMSISNNPAIPATITGAASVCPGATGVPYSVPAVSGASGYFWSIPVGATIASGANTPSITVNFPASFSGASSVCVAATSACGSSVARCKSVSSGIPNQPAGVNGPTTNVCNSTVQYSVVNPPGGVTYTWTNPAGTTIQSGQGSATILLNVSGTFNSGFLSVVANSVLCAPAVSPARTITIFGKPNLPSVEAANPGSWCNGGFVNFSVASVTPTPTWNWIVSNGTITAGQTSNNIDVTWGTGTGNVSVTAVNSCGSSVTRTQSWTGLSCREEGMSASGNFSVYPNPAHDKVTVSIYVEGQTQFNVKLRDLSGRVLLSEDHEGIAGLNAYEMDLKSFAKGIYTLEVQSAGDSWKTKVVVE